jgi:hypothetical protein
MAHFTGVVGLVAGRAEKQARRVQQLADGKMSISNRHQARCTSSAGSAGRSASQTASNPAQTLTAMMSVWATKRIPGR